MTQIPNSKSYFPVILKKTGKIPEKPVIFLEFSNLNEIEHTSAA